MLICYCATCLILFNVSFKKQKLIYSFIYFITYYEFSVNDLAVNILDFVDLSCIFKCIFQGTI